MNHDSISGTESRRGFKQVLIETTIVTLAGLAVSLAANWMSPQGLDLRKNYFPGPIPTVVAPPFKPATVNAGDSKTNAPSIEEQFIAQIKSYGLQVVDREQALNLFRDPRYEQGILVFVDSRNREEYKAGHVPGAYLCNHYHPEQFLPTVFPACQMAEQIVVYCNGGDCEDSKFTAIMLRDAGVANEKLFIFPGGMMNWITNGLPVEIGERNSGIITNAVEGAVQ